MVKVIKAVNKEIHSLKNKRKPSKALLLKKSTKEFYNKSLATIRNKLETLDRSIRKKQRRKFIRDNSRYEKKRNRWFSKRKIQQNLTEKRKRYKHNRKQRTIDIKNNLTDENAISLSIMPFTTPQKLLLKKGPSFIPTPSDTLAYTLVNIISGDLEVNLGPRTKTANTF